MLMQKVDYDSVTNGTLKTKAITAEMNSMLFHVAINGIYTDKIRAPIRELCTNARDGHANIGKLDVPFDVHLPTAYDQQFYVRDYGCSMTEEEVDATYSVLFASSKRGSNVEVGQIGAGSKSPFAYTSGFAVTCWRDGIERIYSMFLDSQGAPQIALLSKEPSDEPTGIKVAFPVKSYDINQFRDAARAVFFGFPTPPNVLNETFKLANPKVLLSGDTWKAYDNVDFPLNSGIYARQGCVIYPVSEDFRRNNYPNLSRYMNLIVDFPIGTISFTTSRESLGYDETTIANLKEGFDIVVSELKDHASALFNNFPNYWAAADHFISTFQGGSNTAAGALISAVGGQVFYKGLLLKKSFKLGIGTQSNNHNGMYFIGDDVRLGKECYNLSFRARSNDVELIKNSMETLKVVVEVSGLKQGPSRMRRYLSGHKTSDSVLWLRVVYMADAKSWAKERGDVTLIDLSSFEPMTPQKRTTVATKTIRMRYFTALQNFSRYYAGTPSAVYEDVIPTKDMLFVDQDAGSYALVKDKYNHSLTNVSELLHELVLAGVFADGQRVYCVNQVNCGRVEKAVGKNYPRLRDSIELKIEEKFKLKSLNLMDSSYEIERNRRLTKSLIDSGGPLWGSIEAFTKKYPCLSTTDPNALTDHQRVAIKRWFPNAFKPVDETKVMADKSDLLAEYEVLSELIESYRNKPSVVKHYLTIEHAFQKGQSK